MTEMTAEILDTHRVLYHNWTMDRFAWGYLPDIQDAQTRAREALGDQYGREGEDWFFVGGENGSQWIYFTDPRRATMFKLSWNIA